MRETFLPFHLPEIGPEEVKAVTETMVNGWITTGPRTRQFESDFSAKIGAPEAVAVNSCTAALHLALEAVGVKEGDEVIVPTMTFAATAEVVLYLKARPILVDSEPGNLCMDPRAFERAITPKTKAVIPVHFAGQPCDMDPIIEIARKKGIKVIEDAAHSLPTTYKGRMIGTIGDLTCFSFYATKTITTGEGGMVTTSNKEWADRIRMMSLHGISKDAWKRYSAEGSWFYEVIDAGYKYNLTDIASSMGIEQLKKCDRFCADRKRIAGLYTEAFSKIPGIKVPTVEPRGTHAWHLYVIQLDPSTIKLPRNTFIDELKKQNIGTSVHFIPLHRHPLYRDRYGYKPADFPVADSAYERILSLPIYSKMTDGDIRYVIEAVTETVKKHAC